MQTDTQETNKPTPRKRRGLFFWVGRSILVLVLILFGLLITIHLPPVQQFGIARITGSMRKNLDTRVTIGGFTLNPISDLTLRNVYIGSPGHPNDTLIYAFELSVDYKHVWDLFKRHFAINQISINDGTLNIHKLAGDSLTNLDIALLKMLPARDTTKPQFVLALHQINALDLKVKVDDESTGSLLWMFLNRADVEIDTLDVINSYIGIHDIDLDHPRLFSIIRPILIDSNRIVSTKSKTWNLDVDHWALNDGIISVENLNKPRATFKDPIGIDYSHLLLDDVDLEMDSLQVRGWKFSGKNINLHVLHRNGFEINKIAASEVLISKEEVTLNDFQLTTPNSSIKNSVSLNFSGFTDFSDFADSVKINIPAANVKLYMNDLLAIVPGLQNVDFFYDNAKKDITLQGDISGHINRLKILNLNGSMGGVSLTGDLRSRDLAITGSQLISLDLSNSSFSSVSLKEIFSNMKIPPEFDRLGQVSFKGKYDGYPNDFVAFGTFNTGLGKITLDMNLNTIEGIAKSKYSGIIGFENFDQGAFFGIKELGSVTASGRVIEGTGLSINSLVADVTGQATTLDFKGYTYHNARFDGQLTGKLFNGTFDINDPNVDMHFEGLADFRDSLPKFDFIAKVDSIKFMPLGFSKEPIYLRGYFDADLITGKLSQVSGKLIGDHIRLVTKGQEYKLDSLSIFADVDTITQDRFYNVNSDILSGTIRGKFNPVTLSGQLHQYLHEKYPSSIDAPKKAITSNEQQRFNWDLTIHDTKHWLAFAGIDEFEIKNGKTTGSLNLVEKQIKGSFDLPEVHYGGINVYGSTIEFGETNGTMNLDLEVIAADLKENLFFEDVLIQGTATEDSVKMRFKTSDLADIIDRIDMDVAASAENGTWKLSFNPRELKMLDADWEVPSGNVLEIKKKYFNIEDFQLVSGDQQIRIEDIDNKGIKADIAGFDISYLNDLWVNDKFKFSGLYALHFEVDNVFDIKKLQSTLSIPALKVNNVPYGDWLLNASMQNPKDSVRINIAMHNNETELTGEGAYLPPIKSIPKEQQNYLRLNLVTTDFPLDFLEFLLGGNIRDTEGSVNMTMSLTGKANKLDPNGEGKVYNGSTTIDYLGASYSFHDQSFKITENMIDLTGAKLYDVRGNSATITGGITHRYLRNLGLDATINSDRIIGLDVTSEENNVFYGTGIGSVYATFSGTIANPVMRIETTTTKGTHIYIPLEGGASASDRDFVVFLENGLLPANKTTQINLGGIDLTINMTITEDAIVEIIFDENAGEVMRGIGTGDLSMRMARTGNFTMYGKYSISKGDYLFTNFNFIKKPFELLPGGTIQWNGDPYDAVINIEAQYKGLRVAPYTFIQEYLTNAGNDLINEARLRTDVDLTLILTGSLLHPDISFDISFPLLTGQIKAFTESKINTLKADENAMSKQVAFLLLSRTFLPSNAPVGGQDISKGIDNSVGEFLSATFSSILSGFLGDLIPEGKFLTGIDFQLSADVSLGNLVGGGDPGEIKEEDYYVELPLQFFNDRLELNLGGNYVKGAVIGAGEYFAGDVAFSYRITPDGRLKIRAYNNNTLTFEGRKNKVGLGLSYKREYNSFKEIFGKDKPDEKVIE